MNLNQYLVARFAIDQRRNDSISGLESEFAESNPPKHSIGCVVNVQGKPARITSVKLIRPDSEPGYRYEATFLNMEMDKWSVEWFEPVV